MSVYYSLVTMFSVHLLPLPMIYTNICLKKLSRSKAITQIKEERLWANNVYTMYCSALCAVAMCVLQADPQLLCNVASVTGKENLGGGYTSGH